MRVERWRSAIGIVAAVLAVAVAARVDVSIPGSPVPQSLQTLAVVLVGVALGPWRSPLALVAYGVAGALGAPVFAGGARGVEHLVGPSAGYLFGFVVAAGFAGWWWRRRDGRDGHALRVSVYVLAGMVAAHVLILALGWARLAISVGVVEGYVIGVSPFLVGGLAKSVVAAVIAVAWSRGRGGRTVALGGPPGLDREGRGQAGVELG